MRPAPRSRVRSRAAAGGSRWLWNALSAPGLLLLTLLFLLPLLLLMVLSFGTPSIVGTPTLDAGFTLRNFELVFASYNLPVVIRTVLFAVIATGICLVLGYAVAYFAARFAGRFGLVLMALVLLPWLVNYLVRIYAWRTLTADQGILNTLLQSWNLEPIPMLGTPTMVIIGLVYGNLPLMVLPIYASLAQLNTEVIEAGKDLYGSRWATFWHVTLPSSREGVIGGVLLVFLPILGDFATAQFLGGANSIMIGNLIADQFMQAGSQPFGAALTTVLVLGLVLAILVARAAGRRRAQAGVES